MKKILLLTFLLIFSGYALAIEPVSSAIDKEAFQGKQGVIVTHDQTGEEVLAIHASISMGDSLKEDDNLKSELHLKTRKILHQFFAEKPEYRNQDFTLTIKELTPEYFWKENNKADLISKIKTKNIIIIKDAHEEKAQISKEDTIKNIATEYLIPNTVEILKIDDSDILISLATKEKANGSGQEKSAAYQIATRKAQAALTGFIHGENISTNEMLKTISVQQKSNKQQTVKHDITNFDETLRSTASGALSKIETQCWEENINYSCICFIQL